MTTSRSWDAQQDARLLELLLRGYPLVTIACAMQRTETAVRARCQRLAILPHRPLCDPDAGCTKCQDHRERASEYQRVLRDTAVALKDALTELVQEMGALDWTDNAPARNALANADRVLNLLARDLTCLDPYAK